MTTTVAVTGADGRIGRRVVDQLAEAGYRVRGLDLRAGPNPAAEYVVGDLADDKALAALLKDAGIVVHLAAFMSWQETDAAAVFEANVNVTFRLLEAVKVGGGGAEIILASSGEVYPELSPCYLPINEDHPRLPRSHYGMTKLLDEEMAWFYARSYGMPTTVLRFPHTQDATELLDPGSIFSGPRFFLTQKLRQQRDFGNDDVVALLECHDDGSERLILSRGADGQPWRMPIGDTRDTAAGVVLAVTKPEVRGETIALGPAESASFDAVIPRMSELTGLEYVDVRLPGTGPDYTVDISKARQLLGYAPLYTIDRMLDEAASAYHDRQATAASPGA
jgi:nucleoside-diphosphate-sugar epimerase